MCKFLFTALTCFFSHYKHWGKKHGTKSSVFAQLIGTVIHALFREVAQVFFFFMSYEMTGQGPGNKYSPSPALNQYF